MRQRSSLTLGVDGSSLPSAPEPCKDAVGRDVHDAGCQVRDGRARGQAVERRGEPGEGAHRMRRRRGPVRQHGRGHSHQAGRQQVVPEAGERARRRQRTSARAEGETPLLPSTSTCSPFAARPNPARARTSPPPRAKEQRLEPRDARGGNPSRPRRVLGPDDETEPRRGDTSATNRHTIAHDVSPVAPAPLNLADPPGHSREGRDEHHPPPRFPRDDPRRGGRPPAASQNPPRRRQHRRGHVRRSLLLLGHRQGVRARRQNRVPTFDG